MGDVRRPLLDQGPGPAAPAFNPVTAFNAPRPPQTQANPIDSELVRHLSYRLSVDPTAEARPEKCPITMEVMRDPVVAADGYTYEREAIERWLFRDGHIASLRTNLPLTTDLTPNFAL